MTLKLSHHDHQNPILHKLDETFVTRINTCRDDIYIPMHVTEFMSWNTRFGGNIKDL